MSEGTNLMKDFRLTGKAPRDARDVEVFVLGAETRLQIVGREHHHRNAARNGKEFTRRELPENENEIHGTRIGDPLRDDPTNVDRAAGIEPAVEQPVGEKPQAFGTLGNGSRFRFRARDRIAPESGEARSLGRCGGCRRRRRVRESERLESLQNRPEYVAKRLAVAFRDENRVGRAPERKFGDGSNGVGLLRRIGLSGPGMHRTSERKRERADELPERTTAHDLKTNALGRRHGFQGVRHCAVSSVDCVRRNTSIVMSSDCSTSPR